MTEKSARSARDDKSLEMEKGKAKGFPL